MPEAETPNLDTRQLLSNRNMQIIFAVTLSATMGVSLVSPVLPKLVDVFGIQKEEVIMLITAFTLPGVLFAPFLGILADRFGRKQVLVPALILFGIAGASCGFARDFHVLLFFRLLQGIGGSALFTLNNTLIGDLFPGRTRFLAMGLNASLVSLAAAIYPAFGGIMATVHWSIPFFVPLAAIPIALFTAFKLTNPEQQEQQPIGTYFSGAIVSLRQWSVLRLYVLTFFTFVLTFGPIVSFVPLWMAGEYNSNASAIGLILSSSSLTAAIISARLEWIGKHFRVGMMMAVAFLLYSIALWWIPHIPSAWMMLFPGLIFGAAQGLNIPSSQALIVGAAPFKFRGVYMAVNSTVILAGITTGPFVAAIAYKSIGIVGLYYGGAIGALIMSIMLILNANGLDIDKTQST